MFLFLTRNRPSLFIGRRNFRTNTATVASKRQAPPLAFVFDIDGVLIRGPNVIPAAKRALKVLDGDNPFKTKIPFLLMTNGGGLSEQERCRKLSDQLGHPIHTTQYIQAHTILRTFAHDYTDKGVLVLGGKTNVVQQVATSYGFKKAYTTLDVLAWNKSIWPLHNLLTEERQSIQNIDFAMTPISAIFVFHDPRDWGLDIQIICDIIRSNGMIGAPYLPVEQLSSPPKLVFCNPDLIWKSDFDLPRLGQGAFKEAFQAVFTALTGSPYPYVQYGKPTEPAYRFAETMLMEHLRADYGPSATFPEVYMVGDNPESDIAGAIGAKWSSVLVHTGVHDPATGAPRHIPTHECADVEAAVRWAIQREFDGMS